MASSNTNEQHTNHLQIYSIYILEYKVLVGIENLQHSNICSPTGVSFFSVSLLIALNSDSLVTFPETSHGCIQCSTSGLYDLAVDSRILHVMDSSSQTLTRSPHINSCDLNG